MEETVAHEVVDRLRARSVFAHVNRRAGVYSVGVRVVIPDGREAIWDNDGAAGLEAMVLRDGDLVGFVPQLPDSEDLDAEAIARVIGDTDYDAPLPADSPAHPTQLPTGSSAASLADSGRVAVPGTGATAGLVPGPARGGGAKSSGLLDRLRRRGS